MSVYRIAKLASLTAILAAMAVTCPQAEAVFRHAAAPRPRAVPGAIRVRFRPAASRASIQAALGRFGPRKNRVGTADAPALLRVSKQANLHTVLHRLRHNPAVKYAERVYYRYPQSQKRTIPDDPRFTSQWAWDNDGSGANSVADADLDMPEAWSIVHDASDITVAIVDDGFDLEHPDLTGNFPSGGGTNCVKGTCRSGSTAEAQNKDKEFHGSLVAGVIGAVGNNGTGIAGAAWKVNLLPIRTDLRSDSLAAGIRYAVKHGATIINISLGGGGQTQDEKDAIEYAQKNGVLVVVSAGNEDANLDYAVLSYPADYKLPNVIAVGASTRDDHVAGFSEWGSFAVDLLAPGVHIVTTNAEGTYSIAGGTSLASPAVAGVAALIAQHIKNKTGTIPGWRAIKAHLLAGAEYTGSTGKGLLKGRSAAGRANGRKSLEAVDNAVPLIKNVTIDDSAAASGGNGQIDPGENFNLIVTLTNAGKPANDVSATLVSQNDVTVAAPDTQEFGAIAQGATAKAAFPVTANAFSGNHHLLFELDIGESGGQTIKRYFYLNVGSLANNETVTQRMQRTNWDEFQAWHITVPKGGNDLVIYTHTPNNIDIDLLARYGAHPEYDITLNTDPDDDDYTFVTDAAKPREAGHTRKSGNRNGDESIGYAEDTQAGTYQIVAVNFADTRHAYDITACYAPAASDQASFAGTQTEIDEADVSGAAKVRVTRSDMNGAASVHYTTEEGTAIAGTNYNKTSGTLNWADGDNATQTITVPILNTDTITRHEASFKRFHIALSNPVGIKLGCLKTTTITLIGTKEKQTVSTPPPDSGNDGGGGGGGAFGWLAFALLLISFAKRGAR
jgi:subtilisin family serine protease